MGSESNASGWEPFFKNHRWVELRTQSRRVKSLECDYSKLNVESRRRPPPDADRHCFALHRRDAHLTLRIWMYLALILTSAAFTLMIMVPETSRVTSSDQPTCEILKPTFWLVGSHEVSNVTDRAGAAADGCSVLMTRLIGGKLYEWTCRKYVV